MPFGGGSEPGGSTAYRMELSLGHDAITTATFKMFDYVDKVIRQAAEENPRDFLNKKTFSEDLFNERYRSPCIRVAKDRESGESRGLPPFVRLVVPLKADGSFESSFFSPTKEPLVVGVSNANSTISRNDEVRALISFDKVWQNSLGFGVRIKLLQARVYKTALR